MLTVTDVGTPAEEHIARLSEKGKEERSPKYYRMKPHTILPKVEVLLRFSGAGD